MPAKDSISNQFGIVPKNKVRSGGVVQPRYGTYRINYNSAPPPTLHPTDAPTISISPSTMSAKPINPTSSGTTANEYLLVDGSVNVGSVSTSVENFIKLQNATSKGRLKTRKTIKEIPELRGAKTKDVINSLNKPLQGSFLPRNSEEELRDREKALDKHTVINGTTEDNNTLRKYLGTSGIPTHLLKELGGEVQIKEEEEMGARGIYYPSTGKIGVDHRVLDPKSSTIMHELGHRGDYNSILRKHADLGESATFGRSLSANPRSEGIADGFRDRFFHGNPDQFGRFKTTGYSSSRRKDGWNDESRAIYSVSRAHFSQTGENVVQSNNNENEYMHKMLNTSPHAVKALEQNDLIEVGNHMSEAYKQTRKVGTQMSLLDPSHEYDIYDIPESHRKEK